MYQSSRFVSEYKPFFTTINRQKKVSYVKKFYNPSGFHFIDFKSDSTNIFDTILGNNLPIDFYFKT